MYWGFITGGLVPGLEHQNCSWGEPLSVGIKLFAIGYLLAYFHANFRVQGHLRAAEGPGIPGRPRLTKRVRTLVGVNGDVQSDSHIELPRRTPAISPDHRPRKVPGSGAIGPEGQRAAEALGLKGLREGIATEKEAVTCLGVRVLLFLHGGCLL